MGFTFVFNLIKIRSLIAPGFAMSRIKKCATQSGAIKDRILIRLVRFIVLVYGFCSLLKTRL